MTEGTLLEAIANAVQAGVKVNQMVQVAPAVVLWPDEDNYWFDAMESLRAALPQLLTLGSYKAADRTGPAIWLKCAVAGLLKEAQPTGKTPVIYLPGVSRADMRAIESCSRDLQPLAEMQYRGVFWSQANTKDWTLNAFLTSKNGGLGLDVLQDKGTQVALVRALEAGILLDYPLAELRSRQVNAAWLDSLLAPNPTRDVLHWLNDPKFAQTKWTGGRWDVFVARCKKDFAFDPISEGELTAAEKLAGRAGAWAAVWELYQDSYTSFPNVAEQLARVPPPAHPGLFDDLNDLVGYPRANEDAEGALRYQLNAVGSMPAPQARTAIKEAERNHGSRRQWLWARMGRSSLAQALEHLDEIAKLSETVPSGTTPEQMATKYQEGAWRIDDAALRALAAIHTRSDVDAVTSALRAVYVPWLENTSQRFQEVTRAQGHLSANTPKAPPKTVGVCTVFVDGLRYDVAERLRALLSTIGTVVLSAQWTSIPSVTASGKAWASPVAHAIAGKKTDDEFQPSVTEDGKPLSTYNFRKLLEEHGIQVLDKHQVGDPAGNAWVECGDLDHYGHEHGLRLARDLDSQLRQIIERLEELIDMGWKRFRFVTDHGWLLVPGGLPKTTLAKHEVQTRWGRCAVLKDSSGGTPLTFQWDWCKDVQVAMAPGISSFIAGTEYAHGGLSLQECLVPVLELQSAEPPEPPLKVDVVKAVWKGLRCQVEVSPAIAGLIVDIRTKAALADSSVVASPKPVQDGNASVVVPDDAYLGTAAVVVVTDANGTVVQKSSTTIGE